MLEILHGLIEIEKDSKAYTRLTDDWVRAPLIEAFKEFLEGDLFKRKLPKRCRFSSRANTKKR